MKAIDLFPVGKSSNAKQPVVNRLEMETIQRDRILNGFEHGYIDLDAGCRTESAFPASPHELVRDFCAVGLSLPARVGRGTPLDMRPD